MNRNVLVVAHQFPPKSGPGVHRSLQLVKYLRDFGYNPIVLTITEDNIKKKGFSVDRSLLNQIPDDIKIVRTDFPFSENTIAFFMKMRVFRFFWYFLYPVFWDQSLSWVSNNKKVCDKLIEDYDIKLVYTSSSPFTVFILGAYLKKKWNIPWVADIRDPFTDGYMWQFPSKMHWMCMKIWERNILGKADRVIVNTEEVRKLYLKRNISSIDKLKVITNGYY